MRRLGKFLGRILLIFLVVLGAMLAFAPREKVNTRVTFAADLTAPTLDTYFATQESAHPGVTPGTDKRVIWAGAPGVKTPLALVYIHGFSATSEEIRPVPDDVARALGANLIYTRLTGHGLVGSALAKATAGNWVNDMAEALAAGRAAGDRVILIGTSTGGTLAALAALDPALSKSVKGIVFISPNFALNGTGSAILTWPGARYWGPLVAGAEYSFTPMNTKQGLYWTTRYPFAALLPMAALVKYAVAQDYSKTTLPALFLYADADAVVRASATRAIAARWGGPVTQAPQKLPPGNDPYNHVIAGDILSPGMNAPVTKAIIDWINSLGT